MLQKRGGRWLYKVRSDEMAHLIDKIINIGLGHKVYISSLGTLLLAKRLPSTIVAADDHLVFQDVPLSQYKQQFYSKDPRNKMGKRVFYELQYHLADQTNLNYAQAVLALITPQQKLIDQPPIFNDANK